MSTSLRTSVLVALTGLLILLGVMTEPATNAAAAPTSFHSFMSYADVDEPVELALLPSDLAR